MKLNIFLLTTVLVLAKITTANAQELTQFSENVYAYAGITDASPAQNSFGANCGVVIGENAVLVIDTLVSSQKANTLIEQIKSITDKPIKYVVNTHHHLDHTGGNSAFANLGAVIIAHSNTQTQKAYTEYSIGHPDDYGLTKTDMEGTEAQTPTIFFTDGLVIDLGGVHVRLNFPGHSHTNTSITAFIKEDNVLFIGDIIFNKYHPYLVDADINSWMDVLAELDNSRAKIIIPGHGPQVSNDDILEFAVYLDIFDSTAKKLCSGKTQNDAPAIAEELLKSLPDQGRNELTNMVEVNLRAKYLPSTDADSRLTTEEQ